MQSILIVYKSMLPRVLARTKYDQLQLVEKSFPRCCVRTLSCMLSAALSSHRPSRRRYTSLHRHLKKDIIIERRDQTSSWSWPTIKIYIWTLWIINLPFWSILETRELSTPSILSPWRNAAPPVSLFGLVWLVTTPMWLISSRPSVSNSCTTLRESNWSKVYDRWLPKVHPRRTQRPLSACVAPASGL